VNWRPNSALPFFVPAPQPTLGAMAVPQSPDPRLVGVAPQIPIQRWRLNGDNDAVTQQTIELMAKLAVEASRDPAMIDHARQLVRDLPNKAYDLEAERVFDHVKRTVRYVHDPAGMETLSDPRWLLWVFGSGDCDDHATLVAALGMALGMGAAFRTVATRVDPATGVAPWAHVYAVLGVPKGNAVEWVPADTAEGSYVGWEPRGNGVRRQRTWVVANP
jgi:transglutaminase-like putative cysteine protease